MCDVIVKLYKGIDFHERGVQTKMEKDKFIKSLKNIIRQRLELKPMDRLKIELID